MIARFHKNDSLAEFQNFVWDVYGLPDDRQFSLWDLVSQHERFAMRALKGIRKGDKKKITINLLISLAWLMAIANRLHINLEDAVWNRFPMLCSYCGKRPCICKKIKPKKRARIMRDKGVRPKTLADFQKMFALIYPVESRTLWQAGVHFSEEVGEVSEAIHLFTGEHKKKYFDAAISELADGFSTIMGVANSANIDVSKELAQMFHRNCHVCHKLPCVCGFSNVATFHS